MDFLRLNEEELNLMDNKQSSQTMSAVESYQVTLRDTTHRMAERIIPQKSPEKKSNLTSTLVRPTSILDEKALHSFIENRHNDKLLNDLPKNSCLLDLFQPMYIDMGTLC